MSKRLVLLSVLVSVGASLGVSWLRNRRLGSGLANKYLNPLVMRAGLVDTRRSQIGMLEHVGRVSGTVRWTPVKPFATTDGFRIVVPLAGESQWARNVLAAGHCRLEFRGVTYDLDEPRLVPARECPDLAAPIRLASSAVGFSFMRLHKFVVRADELLVSDLDLLPAASR